MYDYEVRTLTVDVEDIHEYKSEYYAIVAYGSSRLTKVNREIFVNDVALPVYRYETVDPYSGYEAEVEESATLQEFGISETDEVVLVDHKNELVTRFRFKLAAK